MSDPTQPTGPGAAGNDLPPGHPAGADTAVSAGEALAGREIREDAVVQADRSLASAQPRPADASADDDETEGVAGV